MIEVDRSVKIVLVGHTRTTPRTREGKHRDTIVSCRQCFHDRTDNPFRRLTVDTGKRRIGSAINTPGDVEKVEDEKVEVETAKGLTLARESGLGRWSDARHRSLLRP